MTPLARSGRCSRAGRPGAGNFRHRRDLLRLADPAEPAQVEHDHPAALRSITSRNDQRIGSVSLTVVETWVEAAKVASASMLSAGAGPRTRRSRTPPARWAICMAVGRFQSEWNSTMMSICRRPRPGSCGTAPAPFAGRRGNVGAVAGFGRMSNGQIFMPVMPCDFSESASSSAR